MKILMINVPVQAHSVWLYIVPTGMYGVVTYLKEKYQNPTIIISENGNRNNLSPSPEMLALLSPFHGAP
jgi:beta-glucosidase/6-phospho-beta-glucosidase/beta-galactosidase